MKVGKAPGPSGIVAEMLKASRPTGVNLLVKIANSVIRNSDIPAKWGKRFIINLYKGKSDALDRGNYRGLKLLDHSMKVAEKIIEIITRDRISIDSMQFDFMPSRGTRESLSLGGLCRNLASKNGLLNFVQLCTETQEAK